MTKLKTVATILSMLTALGFADAASAEIFTGFYDFADTQYTDDFTDVRRGSQINGGARISEEPCIPRSTSPARPGRPGTRG